MFVHFLMYANILLIFRIFVVPNKFLILVFTSLVYYELVHSDASYLPSCTLILVCQAFLTLVIVVVFEWCSRADVSGH